MYEIEKGVEMPAAVNSGGRKAKYPWAKMEIGDSFFVPANGCSMRNVQDRFASAAAQWAKRHGSKFATRQVKEPEPGVRVWRVE